MGEEYSGDFYEELIEDIIPDIEWLYYEERNTEKAFEIIGENLFYIMKFSPRLTGRFLNDIWRNIHRAQEER